MSLSRYSRKASSEVPSPRRARGSGERMGKIGTLLDFFEAFPDEEACVRRLYELRTGDGRERPACAAPARTPCRSPAARSSARAAPASRRRRRTRPCADRTRPCASGSWPPTRSRATSGARRPAGSPESCARGAARPATCSRGFAGRWQRRAPRSPSTARSSSTTPAWARQARGWPGEGPARPPS